SRRMVRCELERRALDDEIEALQIFVRIGIGRGERIISRRILECVPLGAGEPAEAQARRKLRFVEGQPGFRTRVTKSRRRIVNRDRAGVAVAMRIHLAAEARPEILESPASGGEMKQDADAAA